MIPWMLYVVTVSSLAAVAGWALEHALRLSGRPTRWGWVAGILVALLVPVLPVQGGIRWWNAAPGTDQAGSLDFPGQLSDIALLDLGVASHPGLERMLLVAWVGLSLLVAAALLLSTVAIRRERRRWRPGTVMGAPVWISPRTGPAVVGFLRPAIVLPSWILTLEASLQQMVIEHEREHIRAGDSRLLLVMTASLVLFPWNAPLWWMLYRLREAVEVDCDARVLRGPVSARRYGTLLLEVGRRSRSGLFAASAFASLASLERRMRQLGRLRRPSYGRALLPLGLVVCCSVAAVAVPAPERPEPSHFLDLAFGATYGGAGSARPTPPVEEAPFALPGTPTAEQVDRALRHHHPEVLQRGLPAGATVWFVVDGAQEVLHTGIGSGTEQEIHAQVKAEHPAEVSDFMFLFEHRLANGDTIPVAWLIPEPKDLPPGAL